MNRVRPRADSAAALAMMCAASVTAQFVAGKAARDALYLANLPVTSLPAMVVATSVCSILFALASARVLRRLSPASFIPVAFAACAVFFIVEWLFEPALSENDRVPGLPAGLGRRSDPRLGVLADCQRTVQPAIGEAKLRRHHRGRHAGRPCRRPARRARRGSPGHGGGPADARRDQRALRMADAAARRADGRRGGDATRGGRA